MARHRIKTAPLILSSIALLSIAIAGSAPSIAADEKAAEQNLQIDRGTIHLSIVPKLPVADDQVKDWVQRAGKAVRAFYGKYPVKEVSIHVGLIDSGGVQDGEENDGNRIDINLGKDITPDGLRDDWMMTHEMFHLSQPHLEESHSWMSEGMADYLEPVARVRVGQITVEKFWRDFAEGMPQGLPEKGDGGLDHTPTWGRKYWGGCLFWLLADIRIRQETHNAKSIRDAALEVLNADGDGSHVWPIDRLITTYDKGTGTKVFQTLYNEMADKPVTTDLPALWKSLGVDYAEKDHSVKFNEHAPLAEIRRSITAKD